MDSSKGSLGRVRPPSASSTKLFNAWIDLMHKIRNYRDSDEDFFSGFQEPDDEKRTSDDRRSNHHQMSLSKKDHRSNMTFMRQQKHDRETAYRRSILLRATASLTKRVTWNHPSRTIVVWIVSQCVKAPGALCDLIAEYTTDQAVIVRSYSYELRS